MEEALNNQSIDYVKDTYLNELNNKYTVLLRATWRDLLKHMLDCYRKIMTANLEYKNQRTNVPIESSLSIGNYF